jgi:hypothetical protein
VIQKWDELTPGQWAVKLNGQFQVVVVFDCEFGRMWREINAAFAYPMHSPPKGFVQASPTQFSEPNPHSF